MNLFLTSAIDKINELFHQRSQSLAKQSNLTSFIRHLPPEILTEIFRLSACKTNLREPERLYYVDLREIIKVSSVCTQWRQLASGTSKLWTTCLLTPPLPESKFALGQDVKSDLTSLVLANSLPNSHIPVRVDLDRLCPEELEVIFNQYRTRLGALRVYIPDADSTPSWNRVAQYFANEDFPNLRELWVCWPKQGEKRILGQAMSPTTQGPSSVGRDLQGECIPWRVPMNQLTVLKLYRVPVDQCVQFLLQYPNLVEFHCVDPTYPEDFDPDNFPPVTDHPKSLYGVKQLRWRVSEEPWSNYLFSSIQFPSLEKLFLDCVFISNARTASPELWELYKDLMPTVNNIRALDLESSREAYGHFHWVAHTPLEMVERLYFVTSMSCTFAAWLDGLTWAQDDADSRNILSGLKILHVDIRWFNIGDVFGELCKFLSSRREQNGNHAQLERIIIETWQFPWPFTPHQTKILSGFIAKGLVVEVVPQEPDKQG